jgi:pimeloyl-ACP methyl ester carboxylesterase
MMAPLAHMSPTAASAQALPWEWFDFPDVPRPAPGNLHAMAGQAGAKPTSWTTIADGRTIPFKWVHASSEARRPLLILLPGMGITIASFRGVASHLFQSHDLALIDYAGLSGHHWADVDGWPRGGVAIKTMTSAIWAVADALETQHFSLGGNSLGGSLCLVAALENPDRVDRLLLSNPACYPQILPRMYRLARMALLGELFMTFAGPERFVTGVEHIGYVDKARFSTELRERCRSCLANRRNRFRLMEMIRHLPAGPLDRAAAPHVARLGEIRQPVMLSWGVQDPLLATGAGERLAKDLPNCVYKVHPDLAHMPHEEAPDRIGAEWAAFLKS